MGLVWDYQSGYVIDAETGEVVDRIYDYGAVGTATVPRKHTGKRMPTLREQKKRIRCRRRQRAVQIYNEIADHLVKQGIYDEVIRILDWITMNTHHTSGLHQHTKLALAYMVYLQRQGIKPYYRFFKKWIGKNTHTRLLRKTKKILKAIQ